MTFKEWRFECQTCGTKTKSIQWNTDPAPECCGVGMTPPWDGRYGQSPLVIGDEIDRTIAHGVCNDDGSARRFRSRSELRQAEKQAGVRLLERGERFSGMNAKPKPREIRASDFLK